MSTVTLVPLTGTASHDTTNPSGGSIVYGVVGTGDPIVAVTTQSDGEYISFTNAGLADQCGFSVLFDDNNAVLPTGATINTVTLIIQHKREAGSPSPQSTDPSIWASQTADLITSATFTHDGSGDGTWDAPHGGQFPNFSGGFEVWTALANGVTGFTGINPLTGLPWTRADIHSTAFGVVTGVGHGKEYDIEYLGLLVDYSTVPVNIYNLDVLFAAPAGLISAAAGRIFGGGHSAEIYVPGAGTPSGALGIPPGQPLVGIGTPPGPNVGVIQTPNVGNPPGPGTPPNQEGNTSDLNQWRLERFDFHLRPEEHKG